MLSADSPALHSGRAYENRPSDNRSDVILEPNHKRVANGSAASDSISSEYRLPDLLEEATANNPSLRASRLEVDALAQRSRQVSALPDPSVMVGYQPYPLLTGRGTQRSQWRVEQMIPFPGKLGLRGNIADLGSEVAGFEADTFEDELLFQVKHTYYELYRLQQQEALVLAFQDRLSNFEAAAATQYEVGAGMQQAILKAQLERNSLSRVHLDLLERRRTSLEALTRLLNRPSSEGLADSIRIEEPPFPSLDKDVMLEVAFRERPEVGALETASQRADAQIALARKEYLPDFGVNVTYFDVARADVPPTATGRDALAVGFSIKVPLQRGRLKGRLEESRIRRAQVRARQEALETSFETQIADLVSRLERESQQLRLFQDALIPQAETTLEATLSAYTTGRTDFLDLLDAERMLFSLRTGYEDTFALYLKSTAALELALGITSLNELNTL
jgi:outer membrane protein TolC